MEPGQSLSGLTLTVSNVSDGADEILSADGSSIALTTEEGGGWNLAVMGSKDSCEKLTRILFAMEAAISRASPQAWSQAFADHRSGCAMR